MNVWPAAVSLLFLVGCSSSTKVALNERFVDLTAMTSAGGGCDLYNLGEGGSSGTSANPLGLTVSQSLSGMQVLVNVDGPDGSPITKKTYDLAFFQSGKVDEFTAPAPSGNTLLLKYWGTLDSEGAGGCAATDDNGPPGSYDPAGGSTDGGSGG